MNYFAGYLTIRLFFFIIRWAFFFLYVIVRILGELLYWFYTSIKKRINRAINPVQSADGVSWQNTTAFHSTPDSQDSEVYCLYEKKHTQCIHVICDTTKPRCAMLTFFPDHWTKQERDDKIYEIYMQAVERKIPIIQKKNGTQIAEGILSENVRVRIHIKDSAVFDAYPILK